MAKQPFVPVSNVCRIKVAGVWQSMPWVNMYAAQYPGSPPTTAQLQSFVDQLHALWVSQWAPVLHNNCQLLTVQAWDISSAQGATASNSVTAAGGLVPGPSMPVSAAIAISWPVQDRWRGGHFRTYIVGRDSSDVTSGRTLVAGIKTSYGNAAKSWHDSINTYVLGSGAATLGGVRYFPTGTDPATGKPLLRTSGQFRAFGQPIIHSRLDTQRRRLGKELG